MVQLRAFFSADFHLCETPLRNMLGDLDKSHYFIKTITICCKRGGRGGGGRGAFKFTGGAMAGSSNQSTPKN